jgi:putative hemolysin
LPTEEPSRGLNAVLAAIDGDAMLFVVAGFVLLLTVAAESALRNLRRNRLERLVPDEKRLARLDAFLERTIEIFDGLVILRLAATAVLFLAAVDIVLDGAVSARLDGVLGAAGVVLGTVLLTAYGLARRAVRAGPEKALLLLLPFIRGVYVVLFPIRWAVFRSVDGLARIFGFGRPVDDEEAEFRDNVLDAAAAGESAGVLEEEEREMIENLIEFKDQAVSAVMTPRTRVVSLPVDMPFEEVVKAAHECGHSRIPIHEGTVDRIVGLLFVKDLLAHWGKPKAELPSLRRIMRTVRFVPESKSISDLLREFQDGMVHLAVVLDEYGGTARLVTLEDLVEEIVGEIHDELDQEEAAEPDRMVLHSEKEAEVSALIRVDEINEAMHLAIPEDEAYETLGGFLFTRLGRIPREGETVEHDAITFEILEADDRSIRRVRVTVAEPK